MAYLDDECEIYIRSNSAEAQITGLFEVGYNNFKYIKPIMVPYSRQNETLHIILSGNGVYQLNNKLYYLKKGQMFFTPENTPLAYYPEKGKCWSYVWFTFWGDILSRYIPQLGIDAAKPYCDTKHFDEITHILNNMFKQCNKDIINSFYCISSFMQILALEATPIESDINSQNLHINNIKKLIDSNFTSQDFTVDALCGMMHMSHSYICRIFKAHEGITIVNYIENIRLSHAAKLLTHTNYSVTRISEAVGYRDPLHFMKCFKKKYGTTALQYRQRG